MVKRAEQDVFADFSPFVFRNASARAISAVTCARAFPDLVLGSSCTGCGSPGGGDGGGDGGGVVK